VYGLCLEGYYSVREEVTYEEKESSLRPSPDIGRNRKIRQIFVLEQIMNTEELQQPSDITTRRGRPRKHQSNAQKQKAYRTKKLLDATLEETNSQIDSRGRLHGETLQPPEKVEQIVGAMERDEVSGGRKAKAPMKNNPAQFNPMKLTDADTGEERMRRIRFSYNWSLSEDEKEKLIDQLCPYLFDGNEAQTPPPGEDHIHGTLVCKLCGHRCDYLANAKAHIHLEYDKAVSQRQRYNKLVRDPDADTPTIQAGLKMLREDFVRNSHVGVIDEWLKANAPAKTRRPKLPQAA
jgi:hypothetical protein